MLYGMPRFRRPALVLFGALALGAVAAERSAGQVPALSRVLLRGWVADAASDQPVEFATVTLLSTGQTVTTDHTGTFELDVATGPAALHVTAPGRSSVVVDLEVREDGPAAVRVDLPTFAVTLQELLVQASGSDGGPAVARTAADMVAREIPRTHVNSAQVGQSDFALSLRLATSFGGPQAPTIVVDGVVLSRGAEAFERLERIPAADVAEIQVLRGPSAAFLYPFAANGVIVVTTKRGQGR